MTSTGFMVPRKAVLRPHVTTENWLVMVYRGGEYTSENNDVVGGEPIDLITFTCEKGGYGTALLQAGYNLHDKNLEFVRELL